MKKALTILVLTMPFCLSSAAFSQSLQALVEPARVVPGRTVNEERIARLEECIEPQALGRITQTLAQQKAALEPPVRATQYTGLGVARLAESQLEDSDYDLGKNWTIGTSTSLKLFSYDLGRKKGGVADGWGVGAPIRWWGKTRIHEIDPTCRARTYRNASVTEDPRNGTLGGSPVFAITPSLYATKSTDSSDVAIQPAIVLSFLYDTIHFGTGYNLSGPQQGNWFLLFGIGTQIPFETR